MSAPDPRTAVLIDFGGVLTTSVHDAFRAFATDLGAEPDLAYAIACERLGVEPADCVLIDDVAHNLDGAARLGIAGVLHRDAAATIRELGERFGLRATSASLHR
jgi:methionine salvage enolase-phosphatase E1